MCWDISETHDGETEIPGDISPTSSSSRVLGVPFSGY